MLGAALWVLLGFAAIAQTATISGDTTICQNGTPPSITFTGSDGTGSLFFYLLN